jgi:hypothetical protein
MVCDEAQKLVLDFHASSPLGAFMDDRYWDLVAQLCTSAGMIMEDITPGAITLGLCSK